MTLVRLQLGTILAVDLSRTTLQDNPVAIRWPFRTFISDLGALISLSSGLLLTATMQVKMKLSKKGKPDIYGGKFFVGAD